jgi:hypothetical protein
MRSSNSTLVESKILAKWWEFANIDPAKTGCNTNSQGKALDCLWNALGYLRECHSFRCGSRATGSVPTAEMVGTGIS